MNSIFFSQILRVTGFWNALNVRFVAAFMSDDIRFYSINQPRSMGHCVTDSASCIRLAVIVSFWLIISLVTICLLEIFFVTQMFTSFTPTFALPPFFSIIGYEWPAFHCVYHRLLLGRSGFRSSVVDAFDRLYCITLFNDAKVRKETQTAVCLADKRCIQAEDADRMLDVDCQFSTALLVSEWPYRGVKVIT